MPADADLLCEYYLNTTGKSVAQVAVVAAETSALDAIYDNDDDSLNNEHLSTESMDLLKSKLTFNPQQLQQSSKSASNWLDLNWCKIRKSGIGLLNLGNNCYLNATLQCLAYTPPLSQWLVLRSHSPLCKFKQLKGFCSLCEVEKIIYDIFNSCNGFAKPNSLCFNIKKISNVFGVGTQEDASEFFTTLLESMAKSIKFAFNLELKQQQQASTSTLNKKTILDDIFSFQFRSRITCCSCGKLSDTYENTNTWPVDVKYVQDIRKGMLHFIREEVLDGENKYNCDRCNKKVRATKKYSLKTAPNILVVHLKRFDFTNAGKLTHFVTYPEMLNLKPFMSDSSDLMNTTMMSSDLTTYKLYGVLVHLGYTSHSGHYYSYVRGPNDVWYKADDQQVSTVQSQDALGQNAYILFYTRVQHKQSQTKDYFHIQKTTSLNESFNSNNNNIKSTNIPTSNLITTNSDLENIKHKPQKDIVISKFKSTFVAVETNSTQNQSLTSLILPPPPPPPPISSSLNNKQNESDTNKENINKLTTNNKTTSKTLNYDQVLRIKKLNKRRLKLFNKKKELAELKKSLSSPTLTSQQTDSCKKLKKQLRKLKKQIKKYKLKIKKLKRKNKKYLSDTEVSTTTSRETNSLSLLKQYNSSSSSTSSTPSSSSVESSPCSTPKSSRSSFSSDRSSSSSSSSSSSLSSSSSSISENATCTNKLTNDSNNNESNKPLKLKLNDETNSSKSDNSQMSSKRIKLNDDDCEHKRPEFDSSKSFTSSSSSSMSYSNKNKYFNNSKFYTNSSQTQQFNWRNNINNNSSYKYNKYSSNPYYNYHSNHQNHHHQLNTYYSTNYNKNKTYHFSRY